MYNNRDSNILIRFQVFNNLKKNDILIILRGKIGI